MPSLWPGRKKVELITDARQSPLENHLHRKKVYNILQGLRVPVLVSSGAALLLLDNKVLAAILMLISVPLPWVAVVIGNGAGEPHDARTQQVYKPMAARQAAATAQQLEQPPAAALSAGASAPLPAVIEPEPWLSPGGQAPLVIDHEDEPEVSAAAGADAGAADTSTREPSSPTGAQSAPEAEGASAEGTSTAGREKDGPAPAPGGFFT